MDVEKVGALINSACTEYIMQIFIGIRVLEMTTNSF